MNFVETDTLHTVDITVTSSPQVCFGNERGRELVAAIMIAGVDEALEVIDYNKSKLAGVIIDAVDLFPMGTGNQGKLHLTCFCESCIAHFKEEDRRSGTTNINTSLLNKFRNATINKPGGMCPVDELWFNPTSSEMKISHLEFRSYMWKKSRYFIDIPPGKYVQKSNNNDMMTALVRQLLSRDNSEE